MANEHLKYFIEAIWTGKGATAEAKKDIAGVGEAGDKSTKGVSQFKGAVGALAASAVLTVVAKQALDFGKASVSAFSDSEEAYGKFSVVFGEFADVTEGNLESIATATGRSKYELIDFASTIQDTFVPLGFARGEAAKMATEVTELAVDLASFNNLETADVIRDLQSALVGNTETLRKYGVVAQEAQIKQEAITLGLWDGKGAIDAQAKAQAILSLAYKGTTDAQGDAIRTADSYANKQRALEAATLDLKVAIGQGLVPALLAATSAAIPYVNALAQNISVEQEWANAIEEGIISQRKYQSLFENNADIYDRNSDAYAYLLKMTRLHNTGLQDSEATIINYYKGMGLAAQATEDTADSVNTLPPALQRMAMGYQEAINRTGEFTEKTGQSGEELALLRAEAEAVASAFESSFTTALGNTSDAYYTNSVNANMLNQELYNQVEAQSENAVVTAAAALALGIYDEAQIATALNAAIIEEKIKALAIAFTDGTITAGDMKLQMDEIVANSPYTSEVDVLVDEALGNIAKTKDALKSLDGYTVTSKVRVETEYSSTGQPSGSASSGGGAGGSGRSSGGGGNNENSLIAGNVGPQYSVASSSSMAIAAGKSSGSGGGVTQNFYSYTREAQALAWAQAEQLRRQRMDAY